MLKWNDTDLAEFFAGASDDHDAPHSYEFETSRDGLRLHVTILALEHTVLVRLFRNGLPEPVFTVRRDFCSHAHITKGTLFRSCFEAGATKHSITDMGVPPTLERGVRVYIEPQIQVELIEPPYDGA